MRRHLLILGLTTLVAASALAHGRSINIDDDDFGTCTGRNVRFDGEDAHVERVELPANGLRRVESDRGPVSVRGGSAYGIVVCKAASNAADLRSINVRLDGGTLRADGPGRDNDWTVIYYITVPRGGELDLEASNGPLSLADVDGRIGVRSKNGPTSLRNVGGNIDVETRNGPVSITGGSGNVKVTAQNGPLSVKLSGDSWNGGSLEASTKNGPLSVRLPRGYRSGVSVEALGHGPINCRAEGCEQQYRSSGRNRDDDWDDEPRTFAFGSGAKVIRLSTVNGPVTIKDMD